MLTNLTDTEYRDTYKNAILPEILAFTLQTKQELQRSVQVHVPALRNVMAHVLRWIIPSPKLSKTRGANNTELGTVLSEQFFKPKGFDHPDQAAANLINMVAAIVFKDVQQFSTKFNPAVEGYPTAIIRNRSSNKEYRIPSDQYLKKFRSNGAWNFLGKLVSTYANYQFTSGSCCPSAILHPLTFQGFRT